MFDDLKFIADCDQELNRRAILREVQSAQPNAGEVAPNSNCALM